MNFPKTGGKVGREIIIFANEGEKCSKRGKIEGNSKFVVDD